MWSAHRPLPPNETKKNTDNKNQENGVTLNTSAPKMVKTEDDWRIVAKKEPKDIGSAISSKPQL